jgi:hypothetical protein
MSVATTLGRQAFQQSREGMHLVRQGEQRAVGTRGRARTGWLRRRMVRQQDHMAVWSPDPGAIKLLGRPLLRPRDHRPGKGRR